MSTIYNDYEVGSENDLMFDMIWKLLTTM